MEEANLKKYYIIASVVLGLVVVGFIAKVLVDVMPG
jgi:hypothetical protein